MPAKQITLNMALAVDSISFDAVRVALNLVANMQRLEMTARFFIQRLEQSGISEQRRQPVSKIDYQALNQEKIEWLNKLADMEYCKSNPGHWLMSLKDTNMLAKLALRSVALLDELEAAEKKTVEMPTFDGYVPHVARELQAAFRIACDNAGINVTAAGKGE